MPSYGASPAVLEVALRSNAKIAKKLLLEGKPEAYFKRVRKALARNEERVRDLFDHILTMTFSDGRVRCLKESNARKLRVMYIEAVKRGILKLHADHEILDKAGDATLCLAVQSGHTQLSNDAVVELVKRHRKSIEAFKRKHFGLSPEEVEVRSQEAVWRSARLYNPTHDSGAKFSTHLYRWLNRNARARTKGDKGDFLLAREEGLKVISPYRSDNSGDAIDLFDTISVPDQEEPLDVDKSKIRGALKGVGERQRKVLNLRFYKNFTIEMASSRLGISVEQVVKDIEQGLESMRESLLTPYS